MSMQFVEGSDVNIVRLREREDLRIHGPQLEVQCLPAQSQPQSKLNIMIGRGRAKGGIGGED